MKRRVASLAGAVLLLSAGEVASQAIQNVVLRNSFNPVGAGARGLGMGGAFIAVADDGTAASFNPAGLAQLRRSELALVGFSDELRSTLTSEREARTSTTRHQAPDFVGLSIPMEAGGRNLTVQLSYQRAVDLFGQGKATIQDTVPLGDIVPGLRGTGDIIADIGPEQSGAFHTASMATGYQVTSRLSLGASINYWIAEWTAQGTGSFKLFARLPGSPNRVEVPLVDAEFLQKQSLRGLNVNTGFLLKYPRISVGGVFRMPFTGDYNLSETGQQRVFEEGKATIVPVDLDVTSRLHWPRSAGVGVALRPFRGLTLAGDYARSHWSRTFIEDVPAGALLTQREDDATGEPVQSYMDRNFFDLLPASQTATADTEQWRAGVEYLIVVPKVVLPLRAGVLRDRSPVVELGKDEGRRIKGYTVGTGINFNRLVLDVAFERRESKGVVALRLRGGQPVASATVPTETVKEDRIVASLIYRFGANGQDPLKRLFRFLFVGRSEGGAS